MRRQLEGQPEVKGRILFGCPSKPFVSPVDQLLTYRLGTHLYLGSLAYRVSWFETQKGSASFRPPSTATPYYNPLTKQIVVGRVRIGKCSIIARYRMRKVTLSGFPACDCETADRRAIGRHNSLRVMAAIMVGSYKPPSSPPR